MKKINIEDLIKDIIDFNKARGWSPVAQDIAKSIIIEAGELLELYQWDASDKNLGSESKPKDKEKLMAEIADVVWYIVTLCNETGVDLKEALKYKIEHNEKKYPVSQFNGHHNDEFYLKRKAEYRKKRK